MSGGGHAVSPLRTNRPARPASRRPGCGSRRGAAVQADFPAPPEDHECLRSRPGYNDRLGGAGQGEVIPLDAAAAGDGGVQVRGHDGAGGAGGGLDAGRAPNPGAAGGKHESADDHERGQGGRGRHGAGRGGRERLATRGPCVHERSPDDVRGAARRRCETPGCAEAGAGGGWSGGAAQGADGSVAGGSVADGRVGTIGDGQPAWKLHSA